VLILEPLRCDYPWASARVHRFVLEGMEDNAARFRTLGYTYYPYVEPAVGAGSGLLEALGAHACVVVTDDFPAFFLPRMLETAAQRLPVRLEVVDGNGILPIRTAGRVFSTAHSFRRFVHDQVVDSLGHLPAERPRASRGAAVIPPEILRRWEPFVPQGDATRALAALPVDGAVAPVRVRGGCAPAQSALERFVGGGLERYARFRNHPGHDATSGLAPYLHFGHVSAHQIVHDVLQADDWSPLDVNTAARGARSGWWGASEAVEGFLDQVLTWRELGLNMCAHAPDYDRYDSLPEWARRTLEEHASDPRPHEYDREAFEGATTHDPLWNAAQTQLLRDGTIHNYLRMLWGKKILEWTPDPETALDLMISLNNKYAVDGRDPNSYSGIFWVLGRYDRPWGPERPVFGKIRYMTSQNTARKFDVSGYVARWAPSGATAAEPALDV
jgi:deoxyribodipyrimidine photo-lyase